MSEVSSHSEFDINHFFQSIRSFVFTPQQHALHSQHTTSNEEHALEQKGKGQGTKDKRRKKAAKISGARAARKWQHTATQQRNNTATTATNTTTQRHNNATTQQRPNDLTAQRRNDATTQRRNDATKQRRNEATTQRHNDATTQRLNSATTQRTTTSVSGPHHWNLYRLNRSHSPAPTEPTIINQRRARRVVVHRPLVVVVIESSTT